MVDSAKFLMAIRTHPAVLQKTWVLKNLHFEIMMNGSYLQIHFNPVGERIVGSFFRTRYDEDGRVDPILSERVYFYDFAKNFSVFRPVSNSGKHNKANSKDDKVTALSETCIFKILL